MYKKMDMAELKECSIVKCLECGRVLVSTHRHDFVQCNCSNETYVDGGKDYTRIGGMDLNKIHVINCIIIKEKEKKNG